MENIQHRQIDSVIRAAQFMRERQLDGGRFTAVRRRIDAAAVQLPAIVAAQYAAHGEVAGTGRSILQLRVILREDHLLEIARKGKQLMKNMPGIERACKVPPKRASSEMLIEFTRSMVSFVKQSSKVFIEDGLPPDFLALALEAALRLKNLERKSADAMQRQKKATADLATGVQAARADMAIVDALLLPRRRDDRALDHAWREVSKLRKRRGRPGNGRWKWNDGKTPLGA